MGETMVQLNAMTTGPLRYVNLFERHGAGAEFETAVGIVRMGLKAGWISRVGDDEFGKYILNLARGEGVDVSHVIVDRDAPTGVYFIQRGYPTPDESVMFYYRKGSAASRLSPGDLDPEYIRSARLFHISGITPALSKSCRDAADAALDIAREAGIKTSMDANIRLKLWDADTAREVLTPMIRKVDILKASQEEAQILTGEDDPLRAAKELLKKGPRIVVVTLGPQGALAATEGETITRPTYRLPIVDRLGAGDAFTAALISGVLNGWDLERTLDIANAAGALTMTVRGVIEAIPTLEEAERLVRSYAKGN
jgi:2-dehydro-3-deoxygluconokinase